MCAARVIPGIASPLRAAGSVDQDGGDRQRQEGSGTLQATRVSIADLEAKAAGSWRAPDEDWLGGWLLRAADGFTGRANSALAIGDPGVPLARAVREVCAWYEARGLPPMIAVPFPMDGPEASPVDRLLDGLGWPLRSGPAVVMTAEPRATPLRADPATSVRLDVAPDDDWLAIYHYRGHDLPPMARRLMMSARWQAFASVREDGQTIAIGRVAADQGWAGLTAIETHPDHRRRGLATTVTAALAAQAAERGVTGLYLQVESDNIPARALYRGLGFSDHHRYHYRVAPAVS
jgi:N-acetylglutamate synthase